MDMLDKDQLDKVIRILTLAKQFGFESKSSPISLLFDSGADILLLLANKLEVGTKARRNNPGIKFLENAQDVLGNPKQVKFLKREPAYFDPESAKYLRQIAVLLVELKNRRSLLDAKKASKLVVGRPSTKPTRRKSSDDQKKRKKKAVHRTKVNAYYRRRTSKKR